MEQRGSHLFLELGPEFRSAKCLNLCELHLILSDQLRLQKPRPPEGHALLKASYEYANRFAKLRTRNVIVDLRSNLEREGDLHQYEIAQLVNILPKSVEEATALIPSLSRLPLPFLLRPHASLPETGSTIGSGSNAATLTEARRSRREKQPQQAIRKPWLEQQKPVYSASFASAYEVAY